MFNPLSTMVAIWHHSIVSLKGLAQKGLTGTLISCMKCISERKVSFDGWMSDVWSAMDEQPIRLTSTHPYITRAAATQMVNLHLPPWVPADLVMQGWVDVGRMGCSFLAAHTSDIHPSKDTVCPSCLPKLATHCCISPRISKFHYVPKLSN